MDKMDAEFLVSERASLILQEVREKFKTFDEFKIANFLSRNSDLSSQERSLILEQLDQEIRAKNKLQDIVNWVFERSSIEQASSQSVALFHRLISRIFVDNTEKIGILDGTAGLGIDSHFLSLAKSENTKIYVDDLIKELLGKQDFSSETSEVNGFCNVHVPEQSAEITAIEKDDAIFTLLNSNMKLRKNVSCENADVLDFLRDSDDLNHFEFMFFDPSRRSPEIKRIEHIDDLSPSPTEILQILRERSFAGSDGFKLAPKTPLTELNQMFAGVCTFTVSLKNEIKETFVLSSPMIQNKNFAVVLKDNSSLTEIFITSENNKKIYDLDAGIADSGKFLIHPAPALRSMMLIPPDLSESSAALNSVEPATPLIISEKLLSSHVAQTYEIIGNVKLDISEVKKELRKLNSYAFSIKNYHQKLNNFNFNALSAKKGQPAYLFLVRTDEGLRCIVTKRIDQERS